MQHKNWEISQNEMPFKCYRITVILRTICYMLTCLIDLDSTWNSLIHLFIKYLLSACQALGLVLGTKDAGYGSSILQQSEKKTNR